ncbi:MAG TPA: Gfo/Idh/MocA family oxidoreductase [Conexibacter sp.]
MTDIDLKIHAELPQRRDWGIGCIGSGWIMRDIQLAAYAEAGFEVVAIASRTEERARTAAAQWGIPTVHRDWRELLADARVRIVDVAYPPDQQLEIVREAVAHADHIEGILAQKPLALDFAEAREIVRLCDEAGIALAVNQNMRYDQSMRALKSLLDGGQLGEPVVGEIVLNTPAHWQDYIRDYERTTLLNLSVHHLDVFRHLFGDPDAIMTSVRPDPSLDHPNADGSAFYVLEYADGLRAVGVDNCFSWADPRIDWRVEGTEGIAKGTIGWPDYPEGSPSTIDYTLRGEPGTWHRPRWQERWFPQAFIGTMAQLLRAVEGGGEPEISGRDNLKTMALIEAAYRSAAERRTVELQEILAHA